MSLKSSFEQLKKQPKKLFLIDGFGALVSAILLGIVLPQFVTFFGMPQSALYILAIFPVVFMLYDFICYFSVNKKWQPFLRIIAIANLGYCLLSIGFLLQHFQKLTIWGWGYFIGELLIVVGLAVVELWVIKTERA